MNTPTTAVAHFRLRFQATVIPNIVPAKKLRMVDNPIKPSVQGIATARTSDTGVGNLEREIPNWPRAIWTKYFPYCTITGSSVSIPKAIRIDSKDSGEIPGIRSISSRAGSPGINRGIKKFSVMATNIANKSRPIFRAKYFKTTS